MKISVAMATFNGAQFLEAQLNSILNQERVPDEIVVSDDNSTDGTFEILQKFQRDANLEMIVVKNEGASGYTQNFANALARTTGDLIFLSDQDDVWGKAKINKIIELSSRFPKHLAFLNDTELTDAELKPTGLTKLGQIKAAGLSRDSFIMGCCAAIRRELLDYCLPIPISFKGHDNWIVGVANGLGATYISEEVLQYYRRHGDNTSILLVNSLKPVSLHRVLMGSMARALKNRGNAELVDLKLRTQTILDRLKSLKGRIGERNEALIAFENSLLKELELTEVRIRARSGNLAQRIAFALSKRNRQLYGKKGAIKKVLRDILA